MTAVEDFAESSPQQRAREKAEHAEWQRLTAINFAHQERIAPGGGHCFCGSLDDLRAAVADLQRDTASASDVRADRVADPVVRAADATRAAQLRVGHDAGEEATPPIRPLDAAHELDRSRDADDAH